MATFIRGFISKCLSYRWRARIGLIFPTTLRRSRDSKPLSVQLSHLKDTLPTELPRRGQSKGLNNVRLLKLFNGQVIFSPIDMSLKNLSQRCVLGWNCCKLLSLACSIYFYICSRERLGLTSALTIFSITS